MKRLRYVLCALTAFLLTAGPAFAQNEADKPAKPKRPAKKRSLLRGEYAIMASVLELTDAQKAELEKLLAESSAKQAEQAKENKAELAAAQEKLKAARKAKDRDAAKAATTKVRELRAAGVAIKAEYQAKIRALMTPEQQDKWAQFGLYRSVARRLSKAKLTDAQKDQVRKMAGDTAKALGKDLTDPGKEAKKAVTAATKKLQAEITEKVLTPEQREAMTKPRTPKKPKPEKAPPAKES